MYTRPCAGALHTPSSSPEAPWRVESKPHLTGSQDTPASVRQNYPFDKKII